MAREFADLGNFYILGNGGVVRPEVNPAQWMQWMRDTGIRLKFLVEGEKLGYPLSVGVKFLGKEMGLREDGTPLVWTAVLFKGNTVKSKDYFVSLQEFEDFLRKVEFKGLRGRVFKGLIWLRLWGLKRKVERIG